MLARRHLLVGLAALSGAVPAQLAFTRLSPTGPLRANHAFAFDTARGVGVLFGGSSGATTYAETWEFNGVTWTQVSPTPSPSARARAAMAFDAARRVVVMHGGVDVSGAQLDDTWTWDGARWTRQSPATRPSARSGSAMAYDSDRQRVVLFGGWVPSRLDSAETWEWDGGAWLQHASGVAPPARGAHRMAYVASLRRTIVFGGWTTPGNRTLGDTWLWDGNAWTQMVGQGPAARCDMSLAFDPVRASVVMFGGLLAFSGTTPILTGDTWELHGGWVQRSPQGTPPSARASAEAVWDQTRGRTVLHGGFDGSVARGETFLLDSVNPARATALGTGCAGSAGVPSLDAVPFRLPWLGGPYAVSIVGAPSTSQALLWLGNSNTSWNGVGLPFDLSPMGLLGCRMYVSLDVSALVPLTNGVAVLQGTLCTCPGFVGRKMYLQALVIDPGAPRPVPGAVTNGLELQYGLR